MTTVAAIDFLKSHPAITELDFSQLLLVDASSVLQVYLQMYPGQLKRLVIPVCPGIESVLRHNQQAVSRLESLALFPQPSMTREYSQLIAKLLKLSMSNISHLDLRRLNFIQWPSVISSILVPSERSHPRTKPVPTSMYERTEADEKQYVQWFEPMSSLMANLTSISVEVSGPFEAAFFLAACPKIEYANFQLLDLDNLGGGSGGHSWKPTREESVAQKFANSTFDSRIRANRSVKILKLEFSHTSTKGLNFLFEVIAATGSSLQELFFKSLNSDVPMSKSSNGFFLCLTSLSEIRRLSIFWQVPAVAWMDVLAGTYCPLTLRYLSISSPIGHDTVLSCYRKIRDQYPHIELRGSFCSKEYERPMLPPREGREYPPVHDIYSGQKVEKEVILDRSCVMPPGAAASICVDCQTFLPEHDLESHSEVRMRRKYRCPNRFYGCSSVFATRNELHLHRLECAFWIVRCSVCSQEMQRSKLEHHSSLHIHTPDRSYLATRSIEWARMRNQDAALLPWSKDDILCPYCKVSSFPLQSWESHIRSCAAIEFQAADDSVAFVAPTQKIRRAACCHRPGDADLTTAQPYRLFSVLSKDLLDSEAQKTTNSNV